MELLALGEVGSIGVWKIPTTKDQIREACSSHLAIRTYRFQISETHSIISYHTQYRVHYTIDDSANGVKPG